MNNPSITLQRGKPLSKLKTQSSDHGTEEEAELRITLEDEEARFLKTLRERIREFDRDRETLEEEKKEFDKERIQKRTRSKLKHPSIIASSAMVIMGFISLILSIISASTILALIGLGLTFWGSLLFYIRPQRYVREDLLNSTALSSLKALDHTMNQLGYRQKGIYIPVNKPEKVVVFIPAEPLGRVPKPEEIGTQTFIDSPKGVVIVPPGLDLANLIESKLGFQFGRSNLEELRTALPKLLVEDLEMLQDFEMQLDGNNVRTKLTGSIYSDLCLKLRGSTTICSVFGCPICSAIACILARVSGKPVEFEKDTYSHDERITESSYRILEG